MISLLVRRVRIKQRLAQRAHLAFDIGDDLLAAKERYAQASFSDANSDLGFLLFLKDVGLSREEANRFIDLRQER